MCTVQSTSDRSGSSAGGARPARASKQQQHGAGSSRGGEKFNCCVFFVHRDMGVSSFVFMVVLLQDGCMLETFWCALSFVQVSL